MRSTVVFSLACLLLASLAAGAADEAAPSPVDLTADVIEFDLARNTVDATGHAALLYRDVTLHANHIAANRATGDVRAEGNLLLTQQTRRLTGDVLQYNTRREEGTLSHARAQEQGVIIEGERLVFSPRQLAAYNALFTTCDLPRPDYALAADQIALTATQVGPRGEPVGGRVSFLHARVIFHGRTLLRLPNYALTIGGVQSRSVSLLPTVGYSHLDGPYASYGHSLGRPTRGMGADFEWRITSQRGIRWVADVHTAAGAGTAYVRYSDREDLSESDTGADEITLGLAPVLVDRKPEVGIRLLDHAAGHGQKISAQVLTGRYVEHEIGGGPETVSASRTSVLALLAGDPHPVSRHVSVSHALGYRLSGYSDGDRLNVLYFRYSIGYTASQGNALTLYYARRDSFGETPFQFDEVEVRDELRSDLRYRLSSRWSVRVMDLYDLDQHRTRDMLLSVTRTTHCLDYTVGWKKLRDTFFVGITIVPAASPAAAPVQVAPEPPAPVPPQTAPAP